MFPFDPLENIRIKRESKGNIGKKRIKEIQLVYFRKYDGWFLQLLSDPFLPSVGFHIENSHLIYNAHQMTGF